MLLLEFLLAMLPIIWLIAALSGLKMPLVKYLLKCKEEAAALSKTYTRYSIEECFKLAISCIIFLNATAPPCKSKKKPAPERV